MRIVVIGAGAAGLMAAATAANQAAGRGAEIIVLEKNRKAGVKILMSGGTRCNLTHDCGPAGIMEAFGTNGVFLRQVLQVLPPIAVVDLFNGLGVSTQIEASTGKIFPSSNRALDVRDALLRYAVNAGADVRLSQTVQAIRRDRTGFQIQLDEQSLAADRVIVTSGGRSYPGCGTIGEGYGWLKSLGHSIVPPRPALVPLVGGEPWMNELSGIALEKVCASVWPIASETSRPAKKPAIAREGSLLFTHQGFSGPVAMDVSGVMTAQADFSRARLTVDLLPERTTADLENWLVESRRVEGKRKVHAAICEWLPKRIVDGISATIGLGEVAFAELPRDKAGKLIQGLKNLPLPVTGTRGFEKAEVTAGGVNLREVDPRTMQSRLVPGLYIAGEVLDLDGWIGGYNFQSAFSTGHAAGLAAAL